MPEWADNDADQETRTRTRTAAAKTKQWGQTYNLHLYTSTSAVVYGTVGFSDAARNWIHPAVAIQSELFGASQVVWSPTAGHSTAPLFFWGCPPFVASLAARSGCVAMTPL